MEIKNQKALKVGLSAIPIVIMLITLSLPIDILPPLGNLFNPNGGIWDLSTFSEHPKYKTISVPSIKNEIVCYYDFWGIPHIFAQTDTDMYFAIGYVQARDRLFQMDIMRRLYTGRLSEVLGRIALPSDIYYRNICLERAANATLMIMKADTTMNKELQGLQSYSDGINYFINHLTDRTLPPEFKLLGYKPNHWEPVHTLAFGKFMSQGLALQAYDFMMAMLSEVFTSNELNSLIPINNTVGMIPVLPNYGSYPSPPVSPNDNEVEQSTQDTVPTDIVTRVSQLYEQLERIQQLKILNIPLTTFSEGISNLFGSNNWVINGSISSSGYPMLCNDMHLSLTMPSVWYEMQHSSVESGINVYGFSFIGAPGVIAGHSQHAAWGFTNVGADVTDYYFYNTRITTQGKHQYLNDTEWQEFNFVKETIPIRGETDYEFNLKFTGHGPVLEYDTGLSDKYTAISMRWTGHDDLMYNDPDYLLTCIQKFWTSETLEDFIEAQRNWKVPGQNFVVATTEGDIAIRPVAKYPIRPKGNWGRLPQNGSDPSNNWLGYIPYEELAVCHNPSQCFLTSTNQKTTGPEYKYFLGSFFDEGYRSRRITELIQEKIDTDEKITIEDLMRFQSDNVDTRARVFKDTWSVIDPEGNLTLIAALNYLNTWGNDSNYEFGEMDRNLVAPTIFELWMNFYRQNIFADELLEAPEQVRGAYPQWNTVENITLYNASVRWFDDVTTSSRVETIEDIAYSALVKALDYLASPKGLGTKNLDEWLWGNYHKLDIRHIADLKPFNSGPYPWDGSGYTLNAAGSRNVHGGPSERVVYSVDPAIALMPHAYSTIPGGQNGHPLSRHYRDQLEQLYINRSNGRYGYHVSYYYQSAEIFQEIADTSSDDIFVIEATLIIKPGG